jgi:putative membrane-bound dehydrogenase-like protein
MRTTGLLLALSVLATAHQTNAALPEPLPGWRMELVAQAPAIRHPSVVACAPDGRVFVAEDPMDISLPKADAAEGRVLCLHPNGKITVFADKLYAVFGLQYLEGKVYVLHNPKFSVFEDDNGVGRNRRDLITQTLPDPSALNWNDHIPANFRLGMDGYFYTACGDKGLYQARGTDGSQATLQTGGIFRIRPDGSQLEVFSHGVRNILDVAVNAEDELFTYDNTDEHDWMGRFTHMVQAGFYGYPHDFIPRRPYTLWMMADYGAGAACGAFAYNEDALPAEFHGNVFLSDFGKRQVMRVRVEREGGTYRAVSKEDLFPDPPGDFRPVGITLAPDGRSIYICDWNHRDEKAEVNVGRLFKLTWTGPDLSAPKPAWYLPAATGRSFVASTKDLLAGLAHPSHEVRLTAQRRLADAASNEPPSTRLASTPRFLPAANVPLSATTRAVSALFQDSSAPVHARIHALWALDAIDHGRSARPAILKAVSDSSSAVCRQAIRQLGRRRISEAVPILEAALKDADASVRFQAASALGSIGNSKAIPALQAALREPDLFARYAVFTALHRIGTNSPAVWPTIADGLSHEDSRVREGTRFALRETYAPEIVPPLVKAFRDKDAREETRLLALELLAAVTHREPEWKGQWWAYHPALQPPPKKTEPWAGTQSALATLRRGLRDTDPAIRQRCIRALAEVADTNSAPALARAFDRETDFASRAAILRALGLMRDVRAIPLVERELRTPTSPALTLAAITTAETIGNEAAKQALTTFLASTSATPETLSAAVSALGQLHVAAAQNRIEQLARHADAIVRAASMTALGKLRGEAALAALEIALNDSAPEVRRAVVRALNDLKSTNAVPLLLRAHAEEALQADAFAALVRTPDRRALEVYLEALGSKNPALRNAAHLAVRDHSAEFLAAIETKASSLPAQALAELRQIYAGNQKAAGGPIFAQPIKQHTAEDYLTAAIPPGGDVERGRRIFAEPNGVNCAACHRVNGQGTDVGPDLSGAGTQFDRRALAEAILFPSRTVREGYQQIVIEMRDGEEYSGVVKGETADILTLRDSTGREHKLPRNTIQARRNSTLSLMPEGLHAALTLEEFADLIAYLTTLKGKAPGAAP